MTPGQTAEVFIYRPIIRGSVEEKILLRQVRKEGLADLIVDKATAHVGLTRNKSTPSKTPKC